MQIVEKYINPFTDFGFKKLFGTEPNKDLLIDFLNQLLKGEKVITDLTFINGEKQGETKDDRKAIFDLYCLNQDGERFIIEIQKAKQRYFKERSLYYSSFAIQEQGKVTAWDFNLKAVYTIGIMDFAFDARNTKNLHHIVKLVETTQNEVFSDKLTFIYLEMPKFDKQENELETLYDKWLFALKNLPKFQERPAILREKIFKKLFQIAEVANLNRQDMNAYQESLKIYRDNKNTMDYAIETAVEEKTRSIIQKLLQLGTDIPTISSITDVPEAEVKQIAQDFKNEK